MFESLGVWFQQTGASLAKGMYQNFIVEDRWLYILRGLGITVQIAIFSILLGMFLGAVACLMKISGSKVARGLSTAYISFIRGTPLITQLLIIYFGIFATVNVDKIVVAVIAFGFNSGAYMAEIFRGGIMAVDGGQMEAGRSLGLPKAKVMLSVIFPQAVKNALPACANEFIVLIKETAIVGYIALDDLTKVASTIQSRTFSPWYTLICALVLYFILTSTLSKGLSILERRLRESDKR